MQPGRKQSQAIILVTMASITLRLSIAAFFVAIIASPAYGNAEAVVQAYVGELDAGRRGSKQFEQAKRLGTAAAIACIPHLAPDNRQRARSLYRLIAETTLNRKWDPTLLQLYDPIAHHLYYEPEGIAKQQQLAAALDWPHWPPSLADAAIRAAPRPTLTWLRRQWLAPNGRLPEASILMQRWGWWVLTGNERQFSSELRAFCQELLQSDIIRQHREHDETVIRFIEQLSAANCLPFLQNTLTSGAPNARAQAAIAIGRMNKHVKPKTLLSAIATEQDVGVRIGLAMAAGNWPNDQRVGDGLAELYKESSGAVRATILYSAAISSWQCRDALCQQGLEDNDPTVRQAAIKAIRASSDPEHAAICLQVLQQAPRPDTESIQALGRLGHPLGANTLLAWYEDEESPLSRLQIALALAEIPGKNAAAAITNIISKNLDSPVLEQLVAVAANRQLPDAVPLLVEIAGAQSIRREARLHAIWALGTYPTPAAIKYLDAANRAYAQASPTVSRAERDEMRAYLAIARLRQQRPDSHDDLSKVFSESTAIAKSAILFFLAEQETDHPVIRLGLQSSDFVVMHHAIKAALASPEHHQYDEHLHALLEQPFFQRLLHSGAEVLSLQEVLEHGLH